MAPPVARALGEYTYDTPYQADGTIPNSTRGLHVRRDRPGVVTGLGIVRHPGSSPLIAGDPLLATDRQRVIRIIIPDRQRLVLLCRGRIA